MPNQKNEKFVVVSGIPPGESGTGRMIRELMSKTADMDIDIRFIHKARPAQPLRVLLKSRKWQKFTSVAFPFVLGQIKFFFQIVWLLVFGSGKLLIMHPQTLGFRLTIWLIRTWKQGRVFMYVLDASYFCVRSYNHIPSQNQPCIECLGGNFSHREKIACAPFPVKDKNAAWYTEQLFELGRANRIKFLSQNQNQKTMLQQHFGEQTSIDVVGLWGQDWTKPFEKWENKNKDERSDSSKLIVFHGFYVAAKGAQWMIELAKHCPELQILCAHPKPVALTDAPSNVAFKNLTWETGLETEVENAFMVMVPSIWSAPIEGALVKSMVAAQRVGIVENETAFQNEVPDSIVLRLPRKPKEAAAVLQNAVQNNWQPNSVDLENWLNDFSRQNRGFISSVIGKMIEL